MKILESSFTMVQIVKNEGVTGLWQYLKGQFQDLKTTVLEAVMSIVQTQVLQAGIKWLLSLLSPVGAIIKVIMSVIEVVKFFVQRITQIAELVKSFVQAIAAIAAGKISGIAASIENALGKAVPVLIGLLASVLGIGGLANKVMGVIRKIRKRIVTAITKFWKFVKKKARKLLRKLGVGKKEKKKAENNQTKDWDDVRVPFKGLDNQTHTLYFDIKGQDTVLMVASTPQTFEEFIKDVTIEGNDERMQNAKSKALKIALQIDTRKKHNVDNNEQKRKKKEKDIAKLTKKLSQYAAILFGIDEQGLPKSDIKHLSTSKGGGQLATGMRAKVLTRNTPKGSAPKQTNTVYEKLFNRMDGNRAYYVRGHLLNDNIGGPGTLENLTPLSQEGNKNHLRVAEEPIKIAVLGGAVVDYILTVKYGRSVPEVSDAQLEAAGFESEKEKETVIKIRANEEYAPKGLSLRSYYLKKDENGKFVRDKELVNKNSVLNPIDLSLNAYKINTERKEKVSILHSSIEDLEKNTPFKRNEIKILKDIVDVLIKNKKRITWNSILKNLKLFVSNSMYNRIKDVIEHKVEKLKNVKIK